MQTISPPQLVLTSLLNPLGLDSFGVCDYPTDMKFLPCRRTHLIPLGAKSIIVFAFPYYTGEHTPYNLSRYTMVKDYHDVCGNLLSKACDTLYQHFGGHYTYFCDVSPFVETELALRAGLGVAGRNHLVLHPVYGSYFFIGEIVTDRYFAPSVPQTAGCMQCGACAKSCPTRCIGEQTIEYGECLSLVSQTKGELSLQQEQALRNNKLVWGCDGCQTCCPHNRDVPITTIAGFADDVSPMLTRENMDLLLETRAFAYRGRALLERNLEILGQQTRV